MKACPTFVEASLATAASPNPAKMSAYRPGHCLAYHAAEAQLGPPGDHLSDGKEDQRRRDRFDRANRSSLTRSQGLTLSPSSVSPVHAMLKFLIPDPTQDSIIHAVLKRYVRRTTVALRNPRQEGGRSPSLD